MHFNLSIFKCLSINVYVFSGFVQHDKIESYIENRERFIKKGKGVDFRTAVQHMDEYASDSVVCIILFFYSSSKQVIQVNKKLQKFRSHANVKPKKNIIKIKTERDIELQLGIKVERSGGCEPITNKPGENIGSWATEKKSLIENIMTLKLENQQLVHNFNEKDAKLNSANVLVHELETRLKEKDLEFSVKLNELNKDLHISAEKDATSVKSISDLKRENSLLMAQNKQLQTLAQSEQTNSDSDENDFYEVQSLLEDKLVSERLYLVRWKGFDSSHDSWERESNLRCTNMLKKYKQSKKKNNF